MPLPEEGATLVLSSCQRLAAEPGVVNAAQFFEVYEADGLLREKRILNVSFRLVEKAEFQHLADRAGFRISALYGSYKRDQFSDKSPYMIWLLEKAG